MRWTSAGHYPPSEAEYRRGWEFGIVSVDASVLLGLYRYSTDTRDELLGLLASFGERLWLTHQAAVEYERNRLTVLHQQVAAYDKTLKAFEAGLKAIRSEFATLSRHPLLDQDELSRMTEAYAEDVTQLIEATRARHPSVGTSRDELMADPTREALERIFDGLVGSPYSDDDHALAIKEAQARIDAAIPPGYLDADKPTPERYGDYLFWQQSIGRARALGAPLILLTDDEKEDWWWRFNGMTMGPRPELVHEFSDVCNNERLLVYATRRFIEEANRSAQSEPAVSAEAIGEVERLTASRTGDYEHRTVDCPHCGSEVDFWIGVDQTYTALPTCKSCGQRFHAFHLAEGTIGTRKPGSPRDRERVNCASCGVGFQVTLPASGRTKARPCFRCGALLAIDDQGGVTNEGTAEAFRVLPYESTCPRCGTELNFVYRVENEERTSCTTCAALVIRSVDINEEIDGAS